MNGLKIKILYNNLGASPGCVAEWGFSALIQMNGSNILFDTGGDAEVFEKNLDALSVSLKEVSIIIISHGHWDHRNGLEHLAGKLAPDYKLYLPDRAFDNIPFTADFNSIERVGDAKEIAPDIWLTGEIYDPVKDLVEQSLVLIYNKELYIITGCSHPGIDSIVERVRQMFQDQEIALVTGGFHIREKTRNEIIEISDRLKALGVKKIAPSHCSGDMAIEIFREQWKEDFVQLYLGDEYRI